MLNPALYNPKDKMYKNKMYCDRLWDELGQKFSKTGISTKFQWKVKIIFFCHSHVFFYKTGIDCSKKWINIRDHYNKNKNEKLGTGSAAESKKRRNELLSFLDEIVTVNKT